MASRTSLVCDLATHSIRTLTETRKRDYNPVYGSDGADLFFFSNDDGTSRIWCIAAHVRDIPPFSESSIAGFSVSPDRQTPIVGHTKRFATRPYEIKQGLAMPEAS
jgi:hypothetical protein